MATDRNGVNRVLKFPRLAYFHHIDHPYSSVDHQRVLSSSSIMMAEQQNYEEDCVSALKKENKLMVEQLLPRIPLPAVRTVTTTFELDFLGVAMRCMAVTLLHLAAYWGWGDVVTALVSVYYCSANSKDSAGQIPLHYAARNGHVEVVKYLITELQCDPMKKDNRRWTPLHLACHNGHLNIAQYLIREQLCNPCPSCETTDGAWTPLHLACANCHAHVVQYLLSTGHVNPLAKNRHGDTALSFASLNYDIIKLFEPVEECRIAFPVPTFFILIQTGDIGVDNWQKKAINASQPVIHFYSYVVYAFLRKLTVVGCTLDDLVSAIDKENDSSLPSNQSVLTEILTTLSDIGLILFIRYPHSSWVVAKTNALLKLINETLFAFKERHDILASNTGMVSTSSLVSIVSISSLLSVFPHRNTDMLVDFLQSLDFCRPVEPSELENTNFQTTPSHSTTDLLFFPGLVQSERPDSLVQHGALEFGWCLGCVDPEQYFSSRFLHILLLSVAYRFSQSVRRKVISSLRGLQRRCTVWKNGISWTNSDKITTLIELLDNNRRVLMAMSCSKDRPMEHAKLRSSLISLVHRLHQEHCSSVEVYECLISPSRVQQYPFNDLPDTDLFDIQDVAKSILCRKPFISSQSECCIGHLPTQSLPLEPYHLLSPSSVCELFDTSNANQPVPATLLCEVQKHFSLQLREKPLVYKELREHLDKLSLFAGSNPLVSCTVACDGSNVSLVCTGGG